MRDLVTAQTVHSEGPRPQHRDAKTASHAEVDDDTGDISDEFDTAVKRNRKKTTSKTSKITSTKTTSGKKKPKPSGTTRRTWPLD